MSNTYTMYCDESCHLENDHQKSMVLGSVWANEEAVVDANRRIKEIKLRNGLKPMQEVKWTKISPKNLELYLDLVDYFFDNNNLNFRCLIIPDKSILNHKKHKQSHNDWYYKMYFQLLSPVLRRSNRYDIYLDIKDTNGGSRVSKLREIIANDKFDYNFQVVHKIQLVRSHEVQLLQIADILIGAMMYRHRGEYNSKAKQQIIERIMERTGLSLLKNTFLTEEKFNLFIWNPDRIDI